MFVFILISVLLVTSLASCKPTPTCPVQEVKQCPGYHVVSAPIFHAFSPMHHFSEVCGLILSALKCVEDLYTSCPFQLKLAFKLQRNVINAVCDSRKEEYIQSISCFSKTGVKANSEKCLSNLPKADTCVKVSEIIACVRNVVKMTDGCTVRHVWLMEELLKLYLKPYMGLMNCSTSSINYNKTLNMSTVDVIPVYYNKTLKMSTVDVIPVYYNKTLNVSTVDVIPVYYNKTLNVSTVDVIPVYYNKTLNMSTVDVIPVYYNKTLNMSTVDVIPVYYNKTLNMSTVDVIPVSSVLTDHFKTTPTRITTEIGSSFPSPSKPQAKVENGVQTNTTQESSRDTSPHTTDSAPVLYSVYSTSQSPSRPPNDWSLERNNTGPKTLQLVSEFNSKGFDKANDQKSSRGGAESSGQWDKVTVFLIMLLLCCYVY